MLGFLQMRFSCYRLDNWRPARYAAADVWRAGQKHMSKCGNRLRYVERSRGQRVQCVMCDQVFQVEEDQELRPISADNK
jgi:hypothetical protein